MLTTISHYLISRVKKSKTLIYMYILVFLDTVFDSLPFEGELDSLTQGFDTLSLPEIELPPVDIDTLGLGLL